MDDPSFFASFVEYRVAYFALAVLLASECAIWLFTRSAGRKSGSGADKGSLWLIVLGWCASVSAGAYFRSEGVPPFLSSLVFPHPAYYLGVGCVVLGVILRCSAVIALKRAFTLSVQTSADQHLITTGLYRAVRNPAYSGSILSLLGVALAYRSIPAFVAVLALCALCYGLRIRVEEQELRRRFRDEFEAYCRQTRYRLIPMLF